MKVETTEFSGLFLVKPQVHVDDRGFFMESYNLRKFQEHGLNAQFIQDNHSSSRRGVLRGLHFQKPPHAQTKLVRVISGSIIDLVLDLRRDQPTYGAVFACELSADNKHQLLVPPGFAHGFAVISDVAEVQYKCDQYYHPESEAGVHILDESLGIEKMLPKFSYVLSEKDRSLPSFASAKSFAS
jgi:dTDP-4-dehydrorhamnose 3,5-epimerase